MRARVLLLSLATVAVSPSHGSTQGAGQPRPGDVGSLPARFVADVPFAAPVTARGDTLLLLLDTGASVVLTDAAIKALHEGSEPRARGTSFISQSVFERWRRQYPAWRVIEHADSTLDMPMIQVPWLRVGGQTVGPVWFTMRPDRNFHESMSQWMDRRVDGALGGSALRYLRVTLDYPRAVATFER